ncbi:hypothetical protein [Clostridium saudiense]|uniref:hypothetical protein n=1 Tax=Clostridium saudiense TaxID=1414720 RepID=UPI0018A91EBB|nr:hypothetical protein [Clostridium saudiense]
MLSFYKEQYKKSFCKEINGLKNNKNKCEDNIVALAVNQNGKWKLINNYILKEDREKNKINVKVYRNRKDNELVNRCTGVTVKKNLKKRLVIVLESPHKREYDIDNTKGYPALGSTGEKINKGILEIIDKKLSSVMEGDKYYDIILMNAIQYQASLGIDTNIFRDRIWISLWLKDKMREEFIQRIKGYRPDIIINLCTKGNHDNDMLSIITGVETTVIGNKFIKSLNIKNLVINNNKIWSNKRLVCEREINMKGLSQGYTLRNFVNNAINEAFKNKITVLKGPHPSSWKFDEKGRLEKSTLDNIKF